MASAPPVDTVDAQPLADWLMAHRHLFVLTGAGCSTASGIPDYRDSGGRWKRSAPITWQAFSGDPLARARYWARSQAGWPTVAAARPNPAHHALVRLQALGRIERLVTQNVDGLHGRAGSRDVIDLHGRIDTTVCLGCGLRLPRASVQELLDAANPGWTGLVASSAPDGDADLDGHDFGRYRVPGCTACGGLLKPDVVFFGENVPRARVEAAHAALARTARERGLPLAILNRGLTRADPLATSKFEADATGALPAALALVGA